MDIIDVVLGVLIGSIPALVVGLIVGRDAGIRQASTQIGGYR